MKKLIIPLVTFALLFACEEEKLRPADHISGKWSLSEPEVPMQISFEIPEKNAGTFSHNAIVNHPLIPESEWGNNNMFMKEEFKDGSGYGKIEIVSRGTFHYIITLIYNRFDEDDNLLVYDVQVDIAGQDYFILQDRVFNKQNN